MEKIKFMIENDLFYFIGHHKWFGFRSHFRTFGGAKMSLCSLTQRRAFKPVSLNRAGCRHVPCVCVCVSRSGLICTCPMSQSKRCQCHTARWVGRYIRISNFNKRPIEPITYTQQSLTNWHTPPTHTHTLLLTGTHTKLFSKQKKNKREEKKNSKRIHDFTPSGQNKKWTLAYKYFIQKKGVTSHHTSMPFTWQSKHQAAGGGK